MVLVPAQRKKRMTLAVTLAATLAGVYLTIAGVYLTLSWCVLQMEVVTIHLFGDANKMVRQREMRFLL